MTLEQGLVDVEAIAGDSDLGGESFVDRIVDAQAKVVQQSWNKNIWEHKRALRKLRTSCERAMWELSSMMETYIIIDSLFEEIDFQAKLTRTEFEELCADLFQSTLRPVERVLRDARLDKSQIQELVLVGGCSRIPKAKALLSSFFGFSTKITNPGDQEVAGLAMMASIRMVDKSSPCLYELLNLEVLPATISVQERGLSWINLVDRDSKVPAKKSKILLLNPHDKTICVYEGETWQARDSTLLAEINLEPLHIYEYSEKVRVKCCIQVDAWNYNASCTLTAGDKPITIPLNRAGQVPKAELERMMEDCSRYTDIDNEEEMRIMVRSALESRIVSFLEALETLQPSLEVNTMIHSTKMMREWCDQFPFAELDEYRRQEKNCGILFERALELSHLDSHGGEALAKSIRAREKMLSQKFTPEKAAILSQIGEITAWISTNPNFGSEQHSERIELLSELMAQLGTGNEEGKDEDESLKTEEPTAKKNTSPEQPNAPTGDSLENLFNGSNASVREPLTDAQFDRVSTLLRNQGHEDWCNVPRLYTVLRLIDQLDAIDSFIKQGISDIWFPFTTKTLPIALQPSVQASFIEAQPVVLSKGLRLENRVDRKHALFSQGEPLPFQIIGRLGRGAHGSVDKIMSTISHKEYARKIFKKTRGLRKEDVRTFITELAVLKRVSHRHCVELLGSYSDPKYFALIIEPVGDYNLAEYFNKAKNNSDMLSLIRGSFGCLANALQYLHRERIRHRDIKPQNIIIKSERVLITDFGIAYNWENLSRGTTTADSSKTLIYAAPEVVRVEARNESADIWSLGCVFLETITVIKGETVQNMRDQFHTRTESYCFHANGEGILAWIYHLRDISSADNVVLDWTANMLRPGASERVTAAQLYEEIVDMSAQMGVFFCCLECQDENSFSTDDDDNDVWGEDA